MGERRISHVPADALASSVRLTPASRDHVGRPHDLGDAAEGGDEGMSSRPSSPLSEPNSPALTTPPLGFCSTLHIADGQQDVGSDTCGWTSTWRGLPLEQQLETNHRLHISGSPHLTESQSSNSIPTRPLLVQGSLGFEFSLDSEGADVADLAIRASPVLGTMFKEEGFASIPSVISIASTFLAAPELDATPIREFWRKGPAIVRPDCYFAGATSFEPEGHLTEWETSCLHGGSLVGAFTWCSNSSLGDEENDGDGEEFSECIMELQHVNAVRQAAVRGGAIKSIRPSSAELVSRFKGADLVMFSPPFSSDNSAGTNFASGSSLCSSLAFSCSEADEKGSPDDFLCVDGSELPGSI
ncbi:hypothetical protein BN946_scf184969.g33 [Trametes cinnabarina]|uniref:Uncharacterized protein n=1 Tax=Pycnoporus cinnabarinus TaxID=5643 RepID=A0A060ST11_PYCCI|nr:hypothetical protein BN946_scf184969.g33 [Trametes cinnabarina]